jgi:hypothetical protein
MSDQRWNSPILLGKMAEGPVTIGHRCPNLWKAGGVATVTASVAMLPDTLAISRFMNDV